MTPTELERFWAKVDKTDACWNWTAGKNQGGYGRFNLAGRTWTAHRLAYISEFGPLAEHLTLDHLCRNRGCVNPDHLEPVTLWENTQRGLSPIASNAQKTHCPVGHELSGDNLRPSRSANGNSYRRCLLCHRRTTREAMRRFRAKGQ